MLTFLMQIDATTQQQDHIKRIQEWKIECFELSLAERQPENSRNQSKPISLSKHKCATRTKEKRVPTKQSTTYEERQSCLRNNSHTPNESPRHVQSLYNISLPLQVFTDGKEYSQRFAETVKSQLKHPVHNHHG